MNVEPRPYLDERDLEKMQALLVAGRQAANGAYYVHTGDLNWWLFYPSSLRNWQETIFLWENLQAGGELSGWALLSPDWRAFDVFVHPREREGRRAAEMFTWAEERVEEAVRARGGRDIRTMWVSERDGWIASHLESRGFHCDPDGMVCFQRLIAEPVPEAVLPDGWCVRPVAGEHEANNRAAASHAAFASSMPFEAYLQRYLNFMRSPAYATSLDLAMLTPEGEVAAFCICWFDPTNRTGLFEPVGTHPDFQKRGLGKAVILAGLKEMSARGIERAIVIAEDDNPAAKNLYRSAGFEPEDRINTFVKKLRSD